MMPNKVISIEEAKYFGDHEGLREKEDLWEVFGVILDW